MKKGEMVWFGVRAKQAGNRTADGKTLRVKKEVVE
jgi:hypothetical protein